MQSVLQVVHTDVCGPLNNRARGFKFVFTFVGATVSWRSIKQQCIADSSTEVDYVVATKVPKELVYLKNFLLELGVVPQAQLPIILYCDNNETVAQSKDPNLMYFKFMWIGWVLDVIFFGHECK